MILLARDFSGNRFESSPRTCAREGPGHGSCFSPPRKPATMGESGKALESRADVDGHLRTTEKRGTVSSADPM